MNPQPELKRKILKTETLDSTVNVRKQSEYRVNEKIIAEKKTTLPSIRNHEKKKSR